jgi:MraZ protein
MFRGNHPARVDEKGRIKIPAEFKRQIEESYGAEFYITSRDGKVAEIYPVEEWRRIEEKLAKLSNFNPSKKRFLNKVNYYGQMAEMDAQARLLLPQILREAAGLTGDVAIYGNLTYLEVRNLEVSRQLAEEEFTAEDEKTLDELGI